MTTEEFQAALAQLELSQREFAAMLGVTPDAVNRWVCGRKPTPTWALLIVRLLLEKQPKRSKSKAA